MPRVSDEYLEQRRQQILDAARRCFARQGFHETSMQDVFRESGLSAGAVYRYFKGKDELIREIAASTLEQISTVVETALGEEPMPGLDEIVGRVATAVQELSGPDGPGRIAPAAWAAALYDPEIAAIVRDVLDKLRTRWVTAVRRMVDEGRLPPGTDADAAGSVLYALFPGFIVHYLILGSIDADTLRRGLRALLRAEVLSPDLADDATRD